MTPLDAEQIHETSLKILQEVGVRLEHDEIVERVIRAGASAGPQSQVVRFSPEMVREYLDLTPSTVRLEDRNGGSACR